MAVIYLLDKSALAPRLGDEARIRIERLIIAGRLAVCEMTMLEVLYSAQSPAGYAIMAQDLNAYRLLSTTAECWRRALEVQALLATTSQHRVPLPDVIIAATAEIHSATVLHNDRDFEQIAKVTGQPTERIAQC